MKHIRIATACIALLASPAKADSCTNGADKACVKKAPESQTQQAEKTEERKKAATTMIYPLSRTKGEQLRAKLVDTTTRQTRIIEIKDDMKELKLECPDDKWTVLILEKFDPEKQKWIEVHKISRGPQKLN